MYSSESELHARPYIVNYESGINAAILSVYYGWTDGINDLLNTPRIAYERHGPLGGVAGTLIGVTNSVLKPLVGTLSCVTWLCRGLYAHITSPLLDDTEDDDADVVNTIGLDDNDEEERNIIDEAVEATGYESNICKQILLEFDRIKQRGPRRTSTSTTSYKQE